VSVPLTDDSCDDDAWLKPTDMHATRRCFLACRLSFLGLPPFIQHSTFALHEIIYIHLLDLYWSIICCDCYLETHRPSSRQPIQSLRNKKTQPRERPPIHHTFTPFQHIHHGLVRRFLCATHASSSCSLTRRRLHSTRSHRPRTVLGWPRQLLQVPGPAQHHRQRAGRREGQECLCAGVEGVRERMRK
jgi:hypothetical protein